MEFLRSGILSASFLFVSPSNSIFLFDLKCQDFKIILWGLVGNNNSQKRNCEATQRYTYLLRRMESDNSRTTS